MSEVPNALPEADRAATQVVIAAYNEAGAIGDVVRELVVEFPNVVVVDDGSHDQTADRALEAGATVLAHVLHRGQGAACED